jgi:NitT/TauT family transport system ATP-binding protein
MTTTAPPTTPTLVLDGVGKRFATGTVALTDVSLSLRPGDFVTVVGPSGCGKSTLLRLASGLETATSGSIAVNATATSYVFQDPTLLEWRSAARNVELVQELRGVSREARHARAQEMLDLVGLTGFERQHPRELSGGMRMRVSIARALVTDPDLLLLDEPFAALDEITRMTLNDDLLRLWESRRTTVVFVTHSVFESVYLSTRIAIMATRPGRIVADLPVELPQPRERALRTSAAYATICATVSNELARAMAEGSH